MTLPCRGLYRSVGLQNVKNVRFPGNRHMKIVRLLAIRSGLHYPLWNTPNNHFCWWLCRTQGHSATERIMPIKYSNDTIGNRTRHLPVKYIHSHSSTHLTSSKRFFTKQRINLYVEIKSVRLWYHMSGYTLCWIVRKFSNGVFNEKLAMQRELRNNGFGCKLRLKRDGTSAETRFRLSEKRTSPFESEGVSA
jgi:hypothetical protein